MQFVITMILYVLASYSYIAIEDRNNYLHGCMHGHDELVN